MLIFIFQLFLLAILFRIDVLIREEPKRIDAFLCSEKSFHKIDLLNILRGFDFFEIDERLKKNGRTD